MDLRTDATTPCKSCGHPRDAHYFGRGACAESGCERYRDRALGRARTRACPRCGRPMLILVRESPNRLCVTCHTTGVSHAKVHSSILRSIHAAGL